MKRVVKAAATLALAIMLALIGVPATGLPAARAFAAAPDEAPVLQVKAQGKSPGGPELAQEGKSDADANGKTSSSDSSSDGKESGSDKDKDTNEGKNADKDKDKDKPSSSSSSSTADKEEPSSSGDTGAQPGTDAPGSGNSGDPGASGPGNSGGSEDPTTGDSGDSGDPSGPDLDPNAVYGLELYATATNSDGNWERPVLDDAPDATGLRWLKEGVKDKGGQRKLLVRATWGDLRTFWQYDEDWRTCDLRYKSSDTNVATVSSRGIVTATGDGEVVFTVTETKSGISAKLAMRVAGQAGAYVTEVQVCDESGRAYEDERITFKDTQNKQNLYVREIMSDNTTVSNAPKAADYNPGELTPVTWSVSDADIGSVNSDTGVFIPKALGSVKVYATATGGDPDVKAGKVRGFVWVVIDDGNYNTTGDMPSDELTVNVIYDSYDQKNDDGSYRYIVSSQHYTIDELKKLEQVQSTYTLTRSDGGYVTASGEGVHLLTLIEKANLKISQVKSFTFTALDGVNPGKMTYDFLFGERYYWPNYEFGGNMASAVNVFPMLAWASDWRDSKAGAEDSSASYDGLGDSTRLRLLFGSSTTADNKTDHSLKYIAEMTIRIEGAPDITDGTGEDGGGAGAGEGGATAPSAGNAGSGPADSAGVENAAPAPDADGAPAPADAGDTHDAADGKTADDAGLVPAVDQGAASAEAAEGDEAAEAAVAEDVPARDEDQARAQAREQSSAQQTQGQQQPEGAPEQGEQSAASQRWHVYQMLNPEDETDFQIDELRTNPLEPWAGVLALGALVMGAFGSGLSFRRQIAPPAFGPQRRAA